MKQLLLMLILVSNTLFGQQSPEDDYLFYRMANLKQDVSSIRELMFEYNDDGILNSDFREQSNFTINKNKQIEKDSGVTYYFETSAPFFIKQKISERQYKKGNWNYHYRIKKSGAENTVFQKIDNVIINEFILDKNNNIIAMQEYNNGVKSFRRYIYEYNNRGILVKETRLSDDVPVSITTYKLNEFDDVIEKLVFDPEDNRNENKYEYVYTYDKNKNWVTKIETTMYFEQNGKLLDKRSNFGYSEMKYTREIKY